MNILLDYFFPISSIEPTPQASTAFLKQVCVVVKPKEAVPTGEITLCTSMSQVLDLTDNEEAQNLFNAGMNRVFVLPMNDLDLASALEGHESDFFTILISSDFDRDDVGVAEAVKASAVIQNITYEAKDAGVDGNDISVVYEDTNSSGEASASVVGPAITVSIESGVTTADTIAAALAASELVDVEVEGGEGSTAQTSFAEPIELEGGLDANPQMNLGAFSGVVGVSDTDNAFLDAQASTQNRVAFHTTSETKAKNMFFAFGKMLSNALNWLNQQYIQMPFADDVSTLGQANALFDDKISFVISDGEFGERLALFAAGGKAIVGPYIKRNLEIDLQSRALSYISGNQPGYTKRAAALLEDELRNVIDSYIERQWIESGTIDIRLEQENFVASGYINISEPKALWRIFGEMRQTL